MVPIIPLRFATLQILNTLWNGKRDGKEFDFSSYAQRVPKKLRKISNTKVAIEGFMIPTIVDENNELKEFLLLPDQMSCCFGQAPEANGWIVVSAEQGAEVMMDRIIRITGELTSKKGGTKSFSWDFTTSFVIK